MSDYLVIYERADDGGWGAYLPDVPGVVAVGDSRPQAERLIREGLELYVQELRDAGGSLPAPSSVAGRVAA